MHSTQKKYIKNLYFALLILLAFFAYLYISSALEQRNKKIYPPEAYGLDSLFYEAEPVMNISVWQRGDPTGEITHIPASSPYDDLFLVSLPLKEGESLRTENGASNPFILITAEYDGAISGEYEIKALSSLSYAGTKDAIPGLHGPEGTHVPHISPEDASFSAERTATLSVHDYLADAISTAEGKTSYSAMRLQKDYSIDLTDYLTTEKLSNLYPDVPAAYSEFYRYVFTTHVTIRATDPMANGVTVAETVLEIKQISSWQGTDSAEIKKLLEENGYDSNYNEITVVSYTQSDRFSLQ